MIVNMIFDSKIDSVLYKGEPEEINYKLLKKIIPLSGDIIPDRVRNKYKQILELTEHEPYCIVYRK